MFAPLEGNGGVAGYAYHMTHVLAFLVDHVQFQVYNEGNWVLRLGMLNRTLFIVLLGEAHVILDEDSGQVTPVALVTSVTLGTMVTLGSLVTSYRPRPAPSPHPEPASGPHPEPACGLSVGWQAVAALGPSDIIGCIVCP